MKCRRKLTWRLTSVMMSMVLLLTMVLPEMHVRADGNESFTATAKQAEFVVQEGDSVTLEVVTNAPEGMELSYQWQKAQYLDYGYRTGDILAEEIGPTLEIEGVTRSADYYCSVMNQYGQAESVCFNIIIENHLTIEAKQNVTYAKVGESALLEAVVNADDKEGLTYDWGKAENGLFSSIANTTSSTYETESVYQYTYYEVRVVDKYGNFAHENFQVFADNGLTLTAEQTVYFVSPGSKVMLEATASAYDITGLKYQWYRMVPRQDADGAHYSELEEIPGAISSSYETGEIRSPEEYQLHVEDAYGNRTTISFLIYPENHLCVEAVDSDIIVTPGGDAVLEVAVTADDTDGITYKWYSYDEGGVCHLLSEETGSKLEIKNITSGGTYECRVSDQFGVEKNANFTVRIDNQLTAVAQESDITVSGGKSATFKVNASAADMSGITYEWCWDVEEYDPELGANVAREVTLQKSDSDTYVLNPVPHSCAIFCRVTDSYGDSVTVNFYVEVENHLTVKEGGTVFVIPGKDATLMVEATADDMDGMIYQWYHIVEVYDEETGELQSREEILQESGINTFKLEAVEESKAVYCRVSDSYGNAAYVSFWVDVNYQFSVRDEEMTFYAYPGENVELIVDVTASDENGLTYVWSKIDDEGEQHLIVGEESRSLILESVSEVGKFRCDVSDNYGSSGTAYFRVVVENDLQLGVGNHYINVDAGENVTLEATVSAKDTSHICYTWYRVEEVYDGELDEYVSQEVILQKSTSNTFLLDTKTWVGDELWIRAEDQYGNAVEDYYVIEVENDLQVQAEAWYFEVKYGEGVTLEAAVSAKNTDGINCRWYEYDELGEKVTLQESASASFQIASVTERRSIWLRVTDRYGNSRTQEFNIVIDNDLDVEAVKNPVYVEYGKDALLEVVVTANKMEGITYQWYKETTDDEELLEGENTATLTVKNVTERCRYYCGVYDQFGNYDGEFLTVSVDNQFSVTAENSEVFVEYGEDATLKVNINAKNHEGMTIQWYDEENDELLEGENASSLIVRNVTERSWYYCRVSDQFGNVDWEYFTVYVDNELSVTAENSEVFVEYGEDATIKVDISAKNDDGMTIQWYKESYDGEYELLEGENASSLIVKNVTKRGWYFCSVSDQFGNATSKYFTVSVENHFSVTTERTDIFVRHGEDATLKVDISAKNDYGMIVQWYKYVKTYDPEDEYYYDKKVVFDNTTGDMLLLEALTDSEEIYCYVEDIYGNTATIRFEISIANRFQARALTTKMGYKKGEKATLKVEVSGDDLEGLTYAWSKCTRTYKEDGDYDFDEVELDEESDTLVTEPITQFTEYRCYVKDQFGNRENVCFYVYVETGMRISKRENSEWSDTSDDITEFSMKVRSNDKVSYIWKDDNYDIIANGDAYSIKVPKGSGWYTCTAVNSYGQTLQDYFGTSEEDWCVQIVGDHERVVSAGSDVTLQFETNINPSDIKAIEWYTLTNRFNEFGASNGFTQTIIEGESSSTLVLKGVTEDGYYQCRVICKNGSVYIDSVRVYVDQKLTICLMMGNKELGYGEEIYVPEGNKVILKANTTGFGDEVTYCWAENRSNIYNSQIWYLLDATSNTLEISPNYDGMDYEYVCYVRDGQGHAAEALVRIRIQSDCIVTFDANGGSGTMEAEEAQKLYEYELPSCEFEAPEGTEFLGWDVNGELYEEWEKIIPGGDVTAKAVWGKAKYKLVGASMSLGNELDMHFFVNKSDIKDTDCYARITKTYANSVNDLVLTIPFAEWFDYNDQYYMINFDRLSAKEMNDLIYVQIFNADNSEASLEWEDSVVNYVLRVFDKQNAAGKKLFADMLNYGAAAQVYFEYDENNSPFDKLSTSQKAYATQKVDFTNTKIGSSNYKGANLELNNNILLHMYFSKDVPNDGFAEICYQNHWGKEVRYQIQGSEFVLYKDTYWQFTIDELAVPDVSQMVTCTIYASDGKTVYEYGTDSIESYVARMSKSNALFEAVMKFGVASNEYFHPLTSD